MLIPLSTEQKQSLLWLSVALALVVLLALLGPVLMPFVVSGILAYVLNPWVDKLSAWRIKKWSLPRPMAASITILLLITAVLAMVLVITGFTLHGWGVQALQLPTWIAALGLLLAYAVVAVPVGAGRRMALYYANGGSRFGWADLWSGVIWLASAALLLWALNQALPELRQLLEQLLTYLRIEAAYATIDL